MKKKSVVWSTFQESFTEANVKLNAPKGAGIYILWVRLKTKKWSCYYVGQASNLQSRLLDHLSDSEENKCIKDNVSKYTSGFEFTPVANADERDGIELFLYDHYSPECNEISPPKVEPIEVNLP